MFVFLLITCWSDCSTLVFPCPLVDAIWDADLIMPIAPCATRFSLVHTNSCCFRMQRKNRFLSLHNPILSGMGCTVTEAANRETLCRSYWWGWNYYYGLSNSNREQKNWLFNSYRLLFDCTSAGIVLLCIYGKWLPLGWESSNSFCHNQC